MSRRLQLMTLSVIVGVPVMIATVLGTSANRAPAFAAQTVSATAPVVLPAALPLPSPVVAPSFADIAERANPAIVSIQNVEFVKRTRRPSGNGGFPFWFQMSPENPDEENQGDAPGGEGDDQERRDGSGSGFFIRKDGYILTNYHVVSGARKLTVTLEDGEKLPATVKGKDESLDIALLKVDASHDMATLPMGDSESLRTGEWVVAIGNPLGYEHSVTVGVVSGKGRPLRDLSRDPSLANYIQTDAAINFGNSGGPLLNARGEVVGINTAITRNYQGGGGYMPGVIQGIGFALPINAASAVLDQLITDGKVSRGALSIQIQPVTDEIQHYYKLPAKKGAFVQKVSADGPAERAGMKNGDIIVSVDGKSVDTTENLIQMISAHRPGDTVALVVLRDGRNVNLKVKLADRSDTLRASNSGDEEEEGEEGEEGEEKPTASVAKLGFTVAEISTGRFRDLYGYDLPKSAPEGVLVTKVSNEGAAYEAGVAPRMIVTQVGSTPVHSLADFRRATEKVEKGQIVRLSVTFFVNPDRRGGTPERESRYIFFEAE